MVLIEYLNGSSSSIDLTDFVTIINPHGTKHFLESSPSLRLRIGFQRLELLGQNLQSNKRLHTGKKNAKVINIEEKINYFILDLPIGSIEAVETVGSDDTFLL